MRTPIDAKGLADFLAKIEAHEATLLQCQRDIENQAVLYRIEQYKQHAQDALLPERKATPDRGLASEEQTSRFAPIDLTTLHVYEEYR